MVLKQLSHRLPRRAIRVVQVVGTRNVNCLLRHPAAVHRRFGNPRGPRTIRVTTRVSIQLLGRATRVAHQRIVPRYGLIRPRFLLRVVHGVSRGEVGPKVIQGRRQLRRRLLSQERLQGRVRGTRYGVVWIQLFLLLGRLPLQDGGLRILSSRPINHVSNGVPLQIVLSFQSRASVGGCRQGLATITQRLVLHPLEGPHGVLFQGGVALQASLRVRHSYRHVGGLAFFICVSQRIRFLPTNLLSRGRLLDQLVSCSSVLSLFHVRPHSSSFPVLSGILGSLRVCGLVLEGRDPLFRLRPGTSTH